MYSSALTLEMGLQMTVRPEAISRDQAAYNSNHPDADANCCLAPTGEASKASTFQPSSHTAIASIPSSSTAVASIAEALTAELQGDVLSFQGLQVRMKSSAGIGLASPSDVFAAH